MHLCLKLVLHREAEASEETNLHQFYKLALAIFISSFADTEFTLKNFLCLCPIALVFRAKDNITINLLASG